MLSNWLSRIGCHTETAANSVQIDSNASIEDLVLETKDRILEDLPALSRIKSRLEFDEGADRAGFIGGYYAPEWLHDSSGSVNCYFATEHIQQVLRDRPGLKEVVAGLHGISRSEVTERMLAIHVLFHEYGHHRHFLADYNHKFGMNARWLFRLDRKAEMETLPHGPHDPAQFLEISRTRRDIRAIDVLDQEHAYSNIPTEKMANDFAVQGMQRYGFVS